MGLKDKIKKLLSSDEDEEPTEGGLVGGFKDKKDNRIVVTKSERCSCCGAMMGLEETYESWKDPYHRCRNCRKRGLISQSEYRVKSQKDSYRELKNNDKQQRRDM